MLFSTTYVNGQRQLRNPFDADHPIRSMSITQSVACRSVIPFHADHPFRSMPISLLVRTESVIGMLESLIGIAESL
jgi:hypothetical protein